jgi:CRP-like cAMP-binding protein
MPKLKMHDRLIEYINQYALSLLKDHEMETIKRIFVPKKLRKRQYFLQGGEVCKYYGFVVKGAMRQYSVDEKGNEHIVQLSIENWWVGDRESFTMLTPSLYFIDAWEETELLTLTQADLPVLDEIPAFLEMKAKMDENHHIALQKRVNASISLSAEKRYEALAQMYPEFLQRFPQHIIASYLGITKETLSRVRGSSKKK